MARVTLKAEVNWFDEITEEFGRIADEFPVFIEESTKAQLKVVEKEVQNNWTSMVPHGKPGDLVYDSIGLNVSRGRNGQDVVGSVGVFKIDRIFNEHGKEKGQINAPQQAWWTEFGTYGNAGIPFLSNAFYATLSQQEKVFKETFEQLVQRTMK
ncbi:hypothetical protein VPH159E362A_0014 [Vibrio phage 159E36-2a]